MPWLDTILVSLLVLWTVGALLYNVPATAAHRWMERLNGSRCFSRWSLFLPANPAVKPGIFEVHFRDRGPDGTFSEWRLGASGFRWAWTASFWLPERFLAAAVQNLGREVRSCFAQRPPLAAEGMERAGRLAAWVERCHPRAAGTEREFRIVRRFLSDGTIEKVLEFSGRTHVAGR